MFPCIKKSAKFYFYKEILQKKNDLIALLIGNNCKRNIGISREKHLKYKKTLKIRNYYIIIYN